LLTNFSASDSSPTDITSATTLLGCGNIRHGRYPSR
jgi:hypothetical protein